MKATNFSDEMGMNYNVFPGKPLGCQRAVMGAANRRRWGWDCWQAVVGVVVGCYKGCRRELSVGCRTDAQIMRILLRQDTQTFIYG